jgi:hypothetical protein
MLRKLARLTTYHRISPIRGLAGAGGLVAAVEAAAAAATVIVKVITHQTRVRASLVAIERTTDQTHPVQVRPPAMTVLPLRLPRPLFTHQKA